MSYASDALIDALERENARLQEDLAFKAQQIDVLCEAIRWFMENNATLRQKLADVTESIGRVEKRCVKLREYIERKQHLQDFSRLVAENSKLRELVREMRVCLEDECKRCHEWGDICDLEQCMRELGIEVE